MSAPTVLAGVADGDDVTKQLAELRALLRDDCPCVPTTGCGWHVGQTSRLVEGARLALRRVAELEAERDRARLDLRKRLAALRQAVSDTVGLLDGLGAVRNLFDVLLTDPGDERGHVEGETRFNGGDPVVLCRRCRTILRYADGRPYGDPPPECKPWDDEGEGFA